VRIELLIVYLSVWCCGFCCCDDWVVFHLALCVVLCFLLLCWLSCWSFSFVQLDPHNNKKHITTHKATRWTTQSSQQQQKHNTPQIA
jgi:hypothetical protein